MTKHDSNVGSGSGGGAGDGNGNRAVRFSVVRTGEPFHIPEASYPDDAGFDLFAARDVVVYPRAFAQIPTNIAIALPIGYWAQLVGRSSTFYRRGLLVNYGVIDTGYRGEVIPLVYNIGERRIRVQAGERLVQLIMMHNLSEKCIWEQVPNVAELPSSTRGTAGFGSTGGMPAAGDL